MAEATDSDARTALLEAAGRASSSLQQSIAAKPPGTPIETNVESLGGLSTLIDALLADASRCGGVDCLGRAIDGVKLWVTRDQFEAMGKRVVQSEERAARHEAHASRYKATLRAIADAVQTQDEMDMLIDWQGTTRAMANAARRVLADDER